MPFDPYKLGERLMLARRRQGLTQKQLEEASGVNEVTIARVERGRMPQVSQAVVYRLAVALGASLDVLTGLKPDQEA
jgi:transcriptional regulator with XRE-family HTH domain